MRIDLYHYVEVQVKPHEKAKTVIIALCPTALTRGQTAQGISFIIDKKGAIMPGIVPTSWVSDNSAVATVDANGLVTALTPGAAGVTALFDSIVSNVVAVTVTQDTKPASIEVTPGTASLTVGQTEQLTAVVKNAAGEPI